MKLARRFDQALGVITAISLIIVFGVIMSVTVHNTFADDKSEGTYLAAGPKFVTFYDDGEKLIVKTDAKTVGEALERAEISLNAGDVVDPSLDTELNADNFHINIYRARPVVVKDGKVTRYLMTASTDIRSIASEAGLTFFDGDEVEYSSNDDFLETGVANVYKIVRNGGRNITIEEEIPYTERTVKTYDLEPGVTEVREPGELGVRKLTYQVQYVDNVEVERSLVSEEVVKEPHERVIAVGASRIEQHPLTPSRGAQLYTYTRPDGLTVTRKETYYDLDMHVVMGNCGGGGTYTVRADGVKVDHEGNVIVAANLNKYPRCSIVETSLGQGKVYDTGGFAAVEGDYEWLDLATDWTNRNGI